ncbi:MHS family MFS transporter [Amycolatopsis sp. K13G38]|uniref:MHS family MFS transporter n=1 Tax=Amycolatopsis acididurans TaxID=2724524 RepID=A0ABX1J6X3_9PSEU|nr:MFS transporter [Amycolatopsis acididurans]NKQ55513.1 MHS family MFS transporter [Amycolatopsis acididurans]
MPISEDRSPVQSEAGTMPEEQRGFRRIAIASLVGTLIEGYDFVLYSLAAALVFPKVFFPSLGPAAGTIASLATLGVAFVGRPVGAILFGHFGDRLGRKRTLIATVTGMGLGTTLMGLIPSADTIGVAAPILIVVLRAVQGVAIGGEWAGAVLFVTEHAPKRRRGLYAMFPQLGHSMPNALSAGTFLLVGLLVSPETFLAWGWRVPFIASILLLAFSLYIRLKVEETPVFEKQRKRGGASGVPLFQAFRKQPRTILITAGVPLTALTFVYVGNAFVANYGVESLGLSRNAVLAMGALSGLAFAGFTVLSAVLSDRLGRRPVIGGSQILGVVWGLVLFPLLGTGSVAAYGLAMCLTMAIAGLGYGAIGAFVPEQFHTSYRYTAAGIAYQITGVIGGGVAPLLAPVIISAQGTAVFGIVLAALSAVAAVCTFCLRETMRDDLDWERAAETRHNPIASQGER